jgi:hypothetical protein
MRPRGSADNLQEELDQSFQHIYYHCVLRAFSDPVPFGVPPPMLGMARGLQPDHQRKLAQSDWTRLTATPWIVDHTAVRPVTASNVMRWTGSEMKC